MAEYKILIVDDDFAMRQILKNIIGTLGKFNIREAENGYKALELMIDDPPDFVFLDVLMPVLTGVETLQLIKKVEKLKSVKVIMCSAEGNFDTIQRAFEFGAIDYIKKPFEMKTVINKTKKWLFEENIDKRL